MFGFLLFSTVVLSAVGVGSPLKISAAIETSILANLYDVCLLKPGTIGKPCIPLVHSTVTVSDSDKALAANPLMEEIRLNEPYTDLTPYLQVVGNAIQFPIFLRVVANVKIICPINPYWDCKGRAVQSNSSVVRLIKVPKILSSPGHIEAQLPFDNTFNWRVTLIVDYDTSDVPKESECDNIESGDFCPLHKPFLCPIFSDTMKNLPCCKVNVDSSCMLRTESNIKTTTNPTTPITTASATSSSTYSESALTTTAAKIDSTLNSISTSPIHTATTVSTPSTTTIISTTSDPATTIPSATASISTPIPNTIPTTADKFDSTLNTISTLPTPATTTVSTSATTSLFSTTSTTTPTTLGTYQDFTESSSVATATDTTATTTSRAVKTDSKLTTSVELPSRYTTNEATVTTPATSIITSTTVGSYQDSTETSQVATAADTIATTTSRENLESTLGTTPRKLCTPATTTTASETVEADSNIPTPCRENVYFWVMIEFILLTAILLISLIFIAIRNTRRESPFVEEEESDEEDPQ